MSAVMTPQAEIAVVPPESRALRAGVTAAMWFPLHEGAGTTLNNRIGAGPASIALAGTTTNVWNTWGHLRPYGDNYAETAEAEAVGAELFDLRDLLGQAILFGYEIDMLDAVATTHTVFYWGMDRSTADKQGGWGFRILGAGGTGTAQFQFRPAAAASGATANTGSSSMEIGGKYAVVHSLTSETQDNVLIERLDYNRVGAEFRTGAIGPVDIATPGTGMPGVDTESVINLFCRRSGVVNRLDYFGVTAPGRVLNNLWFARLSQPVSGLGQLCLNDMIASTGEFPRSLRS